MFVSHSTDLDGDGTILKSEFETTYREAEGVDQVYKEDFKIIDSDGNEKISRLELMVSFLCRTVKTGSNPLIMMKIILRIIVNEKYELDSKKRTNRRKKVNSVPRTTNNVFHQFSRGFWRV